MSDASDKKKTSDHLKGKDPGRLGGSCIPDNRFTPRTGDRKESAPDRGASNPGFSSIPHEGLSSRFNKFDRKAASPKETDVPSTLSSDIPASKALTEIKESDALVQLENTSPIESNWPSTMNPKDVRFTQHEISKAGKIEGTDQTYTVQENAEGLRNGTIKPEDLPPIRVFEKTSDMDEWGPQSKTRPDGTVYSGDPRFLENGQIYTLDNRRLAAFRMANEMGANLEIPVQGVSYEEIKKQSWKFDTKNHGHDISIRS